MILVVDDHQENAVLLSRLIQRAGHTAVPAFSGSEALHLLEGGGHSLLILDVHMPDMSGLMVLKIIRANDEYKHVPILMYSAGANPQSISEAKRLGATDYLVKGSVPVDVLIERICALAETTNADA